MARDLLPMVRQALAGRYSVDREIGRGGAARVFAALSLLLWVGAITAGRLMAYL